MFLLLCALLYLGACAPRPTVLWHGMGDNCCLPFSMGAIKKDIEKTIPGVYVLSLEIGSNIVEDEIGGFIGNVNNQVDYVCKLVKADPNLKNGFNAVGFSQGGQFLRAYIERCNDPPVYNFVTMGGQHQGVADIPGCSALNSTVCSTIEYLLDLGAYNSLVQGKKYIAAKLTIKEIVVQAQYFHDPMDVKGYLTYNKFLTDINNEITVNQKYKENFMKDSVVVPRESSWFWFYKDGSRSELVPYNQTALYLNDTIGLQALEKAGKLKFDTTPGDHMKFTLQWFNAHVVKPYLANNL